jgi:hypothetical protein
MYGMDPETWERVAQFIDTGTHERERRDADCRR